MYGRTKPGTLLKHHIPIKTDHRDVSEPGFTEADPVSHSGSNASGVFIHSLSMTDILTGWVETVPKWDNPQPLPEKLRLMMNLFQPCVKLKKKERIGSKIKRSYESPATPLDRLIAYYNGNNDINNYYLLSPFLFPNCFSSSSHSSQYAFT